MAVEQLLTPKQVMERLLVLKADRGTWENHWQELADFILPRKNDIQSRSSPGQKKNQLLLDSTALISNERLAGALHGLLTNPAVQFFDLTTGDLELDQQDRVRSWLQKTARKLQNIIDNSNFQTEVHELYIDLGCFGTSCMSIMRDPQKVVRFQTKAIRELYIDENNHGVIDEAWRDFKWDAKKIIQEFGEKSVPKEVMDSFKKKDNQKFEIINAIYPKTLDAENPVDKPWVSQYVLVQTQSNLRIAGFEEFPWVVPRWSKVSGEIYGRSPGMAALPEAKTLNKMVETVMKGAQKVVDPPLQVPDDGFISVIRTRPGSLNFYRAGTSDRITPIFNDARIDFGFQALEERRARVRDAFYTNELQLREGPQMTATEVEARVQESLRFLGPVLGRQQSEFLRPLIDRVFEIALEQGLIDPIPAELQGRDIDVGYSSVIARAQMVREARTILRGIEQVAFVGQIDPSVFDNLNADQLAKGLLKLNRLPQEMIRDQDQVDAIREARSQAQQEAVDAQRQTQQADIISKIGPSLVASGGQQT